jgi:hypothetical protein
LGGATPSWGSCDAATSVNVFEQANGTARVTNTTLDLLVGGNSTASAKFAVLNVNNGTPTASVSSGLSGNGLSFDANGNIQTANKATLTIGGTTTGNIALSPLNGQGKVTIDGTSSNPGNLLAVGNGDAFAVNGLGQLSFNPTSSSPSANFKNNVTPIAIGDSGASFTEQNVLPASLRSAASASYNGYVYVSGGFSGLTSVYYARVQSDGTLGAWITTTPLPGGRSVHNMVTYNGYIYVLGGNSGAAGQSTVYYAKLNSDGSVGAWNLTSSLVGTRPAGGAVA